MSKVRVYELAKEADMASKALADKLIDLGYDIRSHSSTVDEETANEIRIKILGTVKTEVVEKRISGKGRTTVIRRRSRTVMPEPEITVGPVAEQIIEEPAAEAAVAEDAGVVAVEAEKPAAEKLKKKKVEKKESAPAVEAETVPDESAAVEAALIEDAVAEQKEEPVAPVAESAEKPKDKKTPIIVKSRKGLARVVKRAAIEIPAAETPVKPARPPVKGKRPHVPDAGIVEVGLPHDEAVEAAKGKKKGKRVVEIFSEDDESKGKFKKPAIGKRKSRRTVEFDDFSEDGRLFRKGRGRAAAKKKEQKELALPAETKAIKKRIKVFETISVGDLAHRMGIKVNQLIAKLMELGVLVTVNQALDVDSATLVAAEFGYEIEQGFSYEQDVVTLEEQEGGGEPMPRPPVVTVMGHVDHGKTSILDAIRKTDVAIGEAGGITQHIGAYYVRSSSGDVVFLDTPGHAAFTEMRSRGAQVTDVVVLVVAADDGVMDQTREAINHAQAAKVPIVVAVNKIDKPDADPERVKRELADLALVPEEWGGQTIFCETSAKKNIGIEELLANIQLQAEILELKADPKRKARGRVIEAQLHKGRGAVATVLIQEGTLSLGEPFVAGHHYGKVRSLINDRGEKVKEAGPSTPVEVQGLSGVPQAGDEFLVVSDEKMARNVSAIRQLKAREADLASVSKISLDKLFEQMQQGDVKELRVVLRADVQGTLEAFGKAIEELSTEAIKVKVLHEGTGTITESDVLLASASEAIIIGFNVRPSVKVKELADREKVDIRSYDVIYHALEDISKAMTGMLEPTYEERVAGTAEVRETFHVPKIGTIAGSYVVEGKIIRNSHAHVLREGVVVYTGRIASLRRFKDDAKEVASGYECGIGVENFNDIKVGDLIESFLIEEVAGVL